MSNVKFNMIINNALCRLILFFFILKGTCVSFAGEGPDSINVLSYEQDSTGFRSDGEKRFESEDIRLLNKSLQILLAKGDTQSSRIIADTLIQKTGNNKVSDLNTLSESYYLLGVFYSLSKKYNESIKYLDLYCSLKERIGGYDERYAKALYNLGIAYNALGDFIKHEDYSLRSLAVEKKIFGESSPLLISTYSSLIIANIDLQEYEKAIEYSNLAIKIANDNPGLVSPAIMADLFNNLGGCFNSLADFSKAKIYLDKCESIYINNHLVLNYNYINLMNNIAITYGALRLMEKSDEYYKKGISLAESSNSTLAYNMVYSYAIILAKNGQQKKGESLLIEALGRAKVKFGENSRNYIEVLNNYADYLRENNINIKKSLDYYAICMNYLKNNETDLLLRDLVHLGFSLSLSKAGEPTKALEIIQPLILSENGNKQISDLYKNPLLESFKPDKKSIKFLKTKYEILWGIYKKSPDQKTLEAISNTSELIVSLVEKVRINISEEASRLILGDRYRDSYFDAIRDFNLLYTKSRDLQYLEKAFEYSEKSKVAGLLTLTRELKAVQFHIPSTLADIEMRLQRDLGLLNARIAEETGKEKPDSIRIKKWNENLLETTRKRDSLITIFEKQYPDYYAIKYNTSVTKLKDIPVIAGRNVNYISYVASDSMLYIFIVNRQNQQLFSIPVDSSFYDNIRQFRKLLSLPSASENARTAFEEYQTIGNKLYKTLVDPVKKYLISDKILISPDNILSYIPFETLPVSQYTGGKILYREVDYLLNHFDISYTYSATYLAESVKRDYSTSNNLIAFAPSYPEPIDIQSIFMNRQADMGKLNDLPFARQEAEYVSGITGGKLFENGNAKESVFRSESGKYDIIHLAMHTVLNDKEPMNSTLIFSPDSDPLNDGYLKTYEIYGIPLKAKMVVLSSCNTGSGLLFSGEGILSLARGFTYSGSQSVVMSMWEIEDKSGTEIIKMFYDNLKKGNSKSQALRKARILYLKKADQLRSHPYFWSTLVIYGSNTPLYHSKKQLIIIISIVVLVTVVSLLLYFRKAKYS